MTFKIIFMNKISSYTFCFRETWYKFVRCFDVWQIWDQWSCIQHSWHLSSDACKFFPLFLGSLCLHFLYCGLPFEGLSLLFFHLFFPHLYPWFFFVFWIKVSFTLRNGLEPVGWDWWFFIKSSLVLFSHKKT